MPPPRPQAELLAALDDCLIADRVRLGRRLKAGRRPDPRLREAIAAARARRRAREARRPQVRYPAGLPLVACREEIQAAIAAHPVVIVCGETGSGKSTQLPKLCLEMGRGAAGCIGHTQPRRMAARAVARRLADELGRPLGEAVGFKVRFHDRVSPDSYVKLMTDGILLAEIHDDPRLLQYDTLIIDEAHERSLNVDFLLGYLKRLLPERPDLKLIVTSATIDPRRFARFFGDAPVIEVSGRGHPVEIRYRPRSRAEGAAADRDLPEAVAAAVDELAGEGPGDILVFLPGERDIREAARALRRHHPAHTEILPLYARLSAAEQDRVFAPHPGRRIVLATNVAETSLTVPGIRYVVDSGLARVHRYSPGAKVQRLPVEPVSRASADQRAGRCGRVAPGICIRLYSEQDYQARPAHTDPEILRSSLAGVILRMAAMGLGEVEDFPFLDPPAPRAVNAGRRLLQELGAVDARRRITPLGRQLARLPVDPRLGRMLLAARAEGCLAEMLVIVSALSVQDPRERPLERRAQADAAHAEFHDPRSDFVALLKLWQAYQEQARRLSQRKLRAWCRERFLSHLRMREWQDIHRQLKRQMAEQGDRPNTAPADYETLHRALLAGLLGQVARRDEQEYRGVRDRRLAIHPASGLAKKKPRWIVAAELVETRRLYAHTVAAVEPEWIEAAAGDLVRRSHLEPHWERKRAQVVAYEQVTLFGLVLVSRRKRHYGPIDPRHAREIFIRHALVQGDYDTGAPFLAHNRALVEDVQALEDKARRRDILVDEDSLFAFYDGIVPPQVCNGAGFEAWRREYEAKHPRGLFLDRDFLMRHGAPGLEAERYPDSLAAGPLRLPLRYRFAPGEEDDGVTVQVPLAQLNQLQARHLDRLVPALLEERLEALLKTLPKRWRRHFVPAREFARACLPACLDDPRPLTEVLAERLAEMTGVRVPPEAWDEDRLPPHLRMRIEVLDEGGRPLAAGRDLEALKSGHGERARASFRERAGGEGECRGRRDWDFGALPESVQVMRDGQALVAYPAVVDEGETVGVRWFDTAAEAARAHRAGVRRLLLLALGARARDLARQLPGLQTLCLHFAPLGECAALQADILAAACEEVFLQVAPPPRDPRAFRALLDAGRGRLAESARALAELAGGVLARHHALAQALERAPADVAAAMEAHLQRLVYPGFLLATPPRWRPRLPVYLEAAGRRLERLALDPARDARRAAELEPHWRRWRERDEALRAAGRQDPALETYRWLLEEYRVSLFAQELKTCVPVSPKRLERAWSEAGAP